MNIESTPKCDSVNDSDEPSIEILYKKKKEDVTDNKNIH